MRFKQLLTKSLLAAVLLCVGQNVWAQTDGTYYIQNVGTGKWLSPANSWETQASVLNHADYWKLAKKSEGVYTLESVVSNGGSKYYLNGTFCDGGSTNLTFTAVGGKENTYTISKGTATTYLTTDGTIVTDNGSDASSENAQWKLYSLSDLTTLMESATPTSGIDATFLIKDHNLSRNNRDYSAWINTGATAPQTNEGKSGTNRFSIEAFQKTFDVHQSLTSIPNGVYGLQVNGFYRQDGSDKLPYLYAGDSKVTLPSRTGTENTMQAAAESFVAGYYLSDRAMAVVTDGNLTVGVGTEGTSCWTIFKNFHLTYYGEPKVNSPLDFTSWITNPGLEDDGEGTGETYKRSITGWTHNNSDGNYRPLAIPAANNTSGAFTGTYCAEIWNGGTLSGKKIYQIVTGLPNGVYKFQLAAMVDGTITNEFIYAASNGQTFTKTLSGATSGQSADYAVYAIVSDGTLEIGLDMNTSGCNWAVIDNARLSYYGASDEAYALVSADLASSNVIPVPSTYSLSATSDTNPFDAGSFKVGKNVTALNVNNTTATAWVGSKEKPFTLEENEAVTISFTAYHGWLSGGKDQGVKLLNSGGHTIAEYVYNLKNMEITAINIGESSAEDFTGAIYLRSLKTGAADGANGFETTPYINDVNYNTVFTFSIRYDGYVTVQVVRGQDNKLYTFSGKLPNGWDIDLQKIQIYSGSNNTDRTIGISNLKVERSFPYDITAVDGSGNKLATIFRGAANTDGSTTAYWNKYMKIGGQWYETTGSYGKAITAAENEVTYTASDIDYFVEAEKMTGYSAAAQRIGTGFSGGIRGRHGENTNWKMGVSISEAGPYTINFPHNSDASSTASTLSLYEVKSDESEYLIEEKSIEGNGTYTKDYDFSAGSDLKISKGKDNSNWLIDYVTLTKKSVTYTVKYMYDETEIKTADATRTAKWGTNVALTAEDKVNIIYNHETYAYSSDDASTTEIAADGSSVITVTFTKVPLYTLADVTDATTWDWSVVTSETAYGELGDGTTPTKSAAFVLKNLELYGKQDGTSYTTPTGFGNAQQLEVIAQYPFRYSSKGMFQGNSVKFHTTVPGTVQVRFSNTGGNNDRPYRHVKVNETLSVNGSANTDEKNSEAIPVQAGDVTITGYIPDASSPAAKTGDDVGEAMLRIYSITFTPVTSVSATVTSVGYATFSSPYDVDFSGEGELTVYKAKVNGTKDAVVVTAIDSKRIPANTGVILAGSKATYTGTVVGSADAISENDLLASTNNTASYGDYILVEEDSKAVFAPMTSGTLATGKAYLPKAKCPASSSAKSMTIIFDSETLGISDATLLNGNAEDMCGKTIYNLSGQRIAAPQKGINIVNGKKIIVK